MEDENFLVSRRRQTLLIKEGQADCPDSILKTVTANKTWIQWGGAVRRALA